jgi:hypothetical protein
MLPPLSGQGGDDGLGRDSGCLRGRGDEPFVRPEVDADRRDDEDHQEEKERLSGRAGF